MARNTGTTVPAPVESDDPLANLSDDGNDAAVQDLLNDAKTLDDEKAALYARIDANRSILRSYQLLGKGSDKQRAAIDLFYPKPNRKPKVAA